ncbi:GNAT family N-acetyltransferase [Mucilaginibacter dorajii]|uniref:GNAT family N-acetyltransferase n=1 Tax=Mucilaginibacter dorajii TaxID=692994 RepID=A0ABP7PH07_9SPHI|nr:GNAT family N-acetyltransferase [Mucilaginibacter dorajii]MCS3735338.1 ribosomal protein S18 acetylase RimI-like enzyme [Mucilaginibacter dorajii]
MQIKQISIVDYQLVTGLFNQYRVFYKQVSDIALAESYIKNRLEHNESVIFVAIDGDEPVGFTQLYPLLSSVRATKNWLLNDLFVDAAHRKQGIGEALLQTAYDFAKSHGATFIELETSVDNFTAQSLYEATGFVRQPANTTSYYYRKAI